MEGKDRPRNSGIGCCVVGCHNTYATREVKFYCFPGKKYESERRKIWIQRIKRISEDGTPWLPKKSDRLCSRHFIGNKMSNIQMHPSYYPSIFPEPYKKSTSTNTNNQALERYKRSQKKRVNLEPSTSKCATYEEDQATKQFDLNLCNSVGVAADEVEPTIKTNQYHCQVDLMTKTYKDVGTQTYNSTTENDSVKEFSDKCWR